MLNLPASVRVFVAVDPCDMRRSYNGLEALTRNVLKKAPCSGFLFLFSNRNRNQLKILYWNGSGYWMMGKRLGNGRFSWPFGQSTGQAKVQLNSRALSLLLEGVEHKKLSLKTSTH